MKTKITTKFSELKEGESFELKDGLGHRYLKILSVMTRTPEDGGTARTAVRLNRGPLGEAGSLARVNDDDKVIVERDIPTVEELTPGTKFRFVEPRAGYEGKTYVKINSGGARLNALCLTEFRWKALDASRVVEVLAS